MEVVPCDLVCRCAWAYPAHHAHPWGGLRGSSRLIGVTRKLRAYRAEVKIPAQYGVMANEAQAFDEIVPQAK